MLYSKLYEEVTGSGSQSAYSPLPFNNKDPWAHAFRPVCIDKTDGQVICWALCKNVKFVFKSYLACFLLCHRSRKINRQLITWVMCLFLFIYMILLVSSNHNSFSWARSSDVTIINCVTAWRIVTINPRVIFAPPYFYHPPSMNIFNVFIFSIQLSKHHLHLC